MSTLISRLYNWVTDKAASVKITASKMDAENDQLIIALNRKSLCSASAPGSPIAGQTWIDTTNKLLKIYLNNEWVVHGPVTIGTSAAATPFEGMLWYDTTNNVLKTYNGSTWDTSANMTHPASTAQGDTLYYTALVTLARLAKGTAAQYLNMNAGATAPQWVTIPGSILDYGVSAATSTARALTAMHICYGRYTLGGNSSVAITNLPFSSASSYYVIVSYGSTVTDLTYACSVDRDSDSQFTIYNSDGVTRYIFWFAIGI